MGQYGHFSAGVAYPLPVENPVNKGGVIHNVRTMLSTGLSTGKSTGRTYVRLGITCGQTRNPVENTLGNGINLWITLCISVCSEFSPPLALGCAESESARRPL
jgi:hypothetical protein